MIRSQPGEHSFYHSCQRWTPEPEIRDKEEPLEFSHTLPRYSAAFPFHKLIVFFGLVWKLRSAQLFIPLHRLIIHDFSKFLPGRVLCLRAAFLRREARPTFLPHISTTLSGTIITTSTGWLTRKRISRTPQRPNIAASSQRRSAGSE